MRMSEDAKISQQIGRILKRFGLPLLLLLTLVVSGDKAPLPLRIVSLGFASGGTCPSGVPSGITSCYYIAANGSDSNAGTTEASPWLHSPGMSACASTCAGVTPGPGIGFIFRGGDTWHFGNSGASPYVGAGSPGLNIIWSGTSSNHIYWGVDHTWFSGGSWVRPIFSGDNPFSSVGVSSCTHDEASYTAVSWLGANNEYFDNIEMSGFCWHGNQQNLPGGTCCLTHMEGAQGSSTPSNNVINNVYIHGWSHVTFSCSLSGGEPTGNCDGAYGIAEGSNSTYGQGDTIVNTVIDGQDTDQGSLCFICFAGYDIHNSVLRYGGNGAVTNNTHVFHDNLIDHMVSGKDGVTHTNGYEFNVEWNASNAVYNNVISNMWLTGICEVTQWMYPGTGLTDYNFNNLQYNIGCNGNYFDAAAPHGTVNVFNNTWVVPSSGAIGGPLTGGTVNWGNNHCIIPGGTTSTNCYVSQGGTLNYLTDLIQTPTVASGQGYTSTETFAYSPAGGSTVGAATNEQTYCSNLLGSSDPLLQAAGKACQQDTTFACSYSTSTHSVTCPARTPSPRPSSGNWDVGAYQNTGGAPMPPTNVKAAPH